MPLTPDDVGQYGFLHCLVLGDPKTGKSTTCVSTAPGSSPEDEGKVYIILSDPLDALRPVKRRTTNFEFDKVTSVEEMDEAVKTARKGVRQGVYKTVVVDHLTSYSPILEKYCTTIAPKSYRGQVDGRAVWGEYNRLMYNLVNKLIEIPAHVLILAHPTIEGKQEDDRKDRKDRSARRESQAMMPSIVPALGTQKSRKFVPGLVQDVVLLQKTKDNSRRFVFDLDGIQGVGARGTDRKWIEADVRKLIEVLCSTDSKVEEPKEEDEEGVEEGEEGEAASGDEVPPSAAQRRAAREERRRRRRARA